MPLTVRCGWCGAPLGEVRPTTVEQSDAIREHFRDCKNPGDGLLMEHPLYYERDTDHA
jgi:hypothetical protein